MPEFVFTMHRLTRVHEPDREVLKDITLAFLPGAKIGVLGPNGAGKSTLLRIMAGVDTEFRGEAQLAEGATVGLLEQEPQLDESKDVRANVEDGVRPVRDMLDRFNELSANYSDETADEFAALQERIDAADAWSLDTSSTPPWTRCACRPATPTSPSSQAASADAWRCAGCCSPSPTCSCSTSPPTTSTPSRSPGWSGTCTTTRARWSRSPTTATSSTTWPAGSSSWTAARGFRSRATTPRGSSRSRRRLAQEEKQESARQRTLARELEWVRMNASSRLTKNRAGWRATTPCSPRRAT